MGQYYRPVIKENDKIMVYNRRINGEYTMAKLMEHSYLSSYLMMTIADKMYKNKIQLLWCGDYAENDEIEKTGLTISDIWDDDGNCLSLKEFNYQDKYFCNHTKKEYVDFNKYIEKANNDGWIISPISLLTAIGNGRGGGDYHDNYINADKVGSWFWDEISIEDEKPIDYIENEVYFIEQ